MRKTSSILAVILLVVAGCKGGKETTDDLIMVDVTTTNYSKKELILQDFMDVEYIALETTDEFINQGFVQDIGEKFILVRNRNSDGDIFIYDRNGKAIRKFNRLGQGPEEYSGILGITLDEDNNEIYVNNHSTRKILVYDLNGNYKRSLKHKEDNDGGSLFYTDIFNYNKDNLICYDRYNKMIPFVLVSKQDGSITKEIDIPFKEKKEASARRTDEASGMVYGVSPGPYRTVIPFKGDWLLLELSSDTIFSFLPDYSLFPFIIRTPPIQSMSPEVFLILRLLSERYYFMETIRNVYDFNTNNGFPKTFMMYDTQEKGIFNYTVYNGDYLDKKGEVYMSVTRPVNHQIDSWYPLEAFRLVESREKGELKGKLKEITMELDAEDNPVIMLIKHKK
jgi:hypothetical protein